MTVGIGNIVQDTDYNGLVSRVRAVLGSGSGQSGYGQLITGLSTVADNSTQNIAHTEWNSLATNINRCSRHQQNTDQSIGTLAAGRIIGADQSGTSVTRVDTGGVITWTHNSSDTTMGVNDLYAGVGNIENNSALVHPTQFTLTTGRLFAVSTRTLPWGGAGQTQSVDCTFEVVFGGGYETTRSSDGVTVTASGADHRRHFFNAGGEIRISGVNTGAATVKGSDWAVMLQNMGQIVFGKNSTTNGPTGSGRARDGATDVDKDGFIDSAVGNYQLTTSRQLIFQRNGGGEDIDYAENTISVYARRNIAGDILTFEIELTDFDEGDQTGTGPAVDERVDGTLSIGLDLRRPTGDYVAVISPEVEVADELF
jgi:hypothetical protein